MKSKYRHICLLSLLAVLSVGCRNSKDIVILYDNDVHCAVDGYAKMAALKAEMQKATPYVATVSVGDYVQGGNWGSISKGEYIVRLMNQVGYDVVTLGNHEYDFGPQQLARNTADLNARKVCCNYVDLRSRQALYPPYAVMRFGRRKVAFVGIATPYTFTASASSLYRDSATGAPLYDFCLDSLYSVVQRNIDAARRDGADYVVLLSHMGTDSIEEPVNSQTLIAHISGADVVLDGHEHAVRQFDRMVDKTGRRVPLSRTGYHFENIGRLTIGRRGDIDMEHIPTETYPHADSATLVLMDSIRKEFDVVGHRPICRNETDYYVRDQRGEWTTRHCEHGLGKLYTDALRVMLSTDIAMTNGGGIRDKLPAGAVTYSDLLSVFPFGNEVYTGTITGADLLDELEYSVWSMPVNFGSFMQVSGLRFEVDTTVASPVEFDKNMVFVRVRPDSRRRVSHVEVLDPETDTYRPLDPEATYTIASTRYCVVDHGDGNAAMKVADVRNTKTLELDLLEQYIDKVLHGTIPESYNTEGERIIVR